MRDFQSIGRRAAEERAWWKEVPALEETRDAASTLRLNSGRRKLGHTPFCNRRKVWCRGPAPSGASCDAGALGFLRGKREPRRSLLSVAGVRLISLRSPPAPHRCGPWGFWICARKCSAPPTFTKCWACGARPQTARSDAAITRCPCRCTRTGWARATRRTPPAASRCARPRSAGCLGFSPSSGRLTPPRWSEPNPAWRFLIFICRGAVSVRGAGLIFGCSFPQILGKVYSVLSDKDQRAVYDEQGTVDEDSDVLSKDRDWEAYWRLLFKKVKNSGDFLVTVSIIHSTNVY